MRRVLPIAIPSFVGVVLAGATGGRLPSTIAVSLMLIAANIAVARLRLATRHPNVEDGTELALPLASAWLLVVIAPNHDFVQRSNDAATSSIGIQPVIELLYFLVVGAFSIWILRRLDPTMSRLGVPLAILAFPLWCMVSMFWSLLPPYSMVRGLQMVILAVLAWATAALGAEFPGTLRSMLTMVLAWFVRIVLVLIALGVALGPIFVPTGGDNLLRFTWIGAHPNASGLMLAMGLVVLLAAPTDVLRMPMVLRLASIGACGAALYQNNSRTALVCLAVGGMTCLVLGARRSPLVRFAVTPYAAAGLVLSAVVFREQILDFAFRGGDGEELATGNGRLGLWADGYRLLRTAFDWLFGLGFGSARVVFLTPEKYWAKSAHSSALAVLVSLGLVGLLCFAALVISTATRLVRGRLHDDSTGTVLIGLFAVLFVNGVVADTAAEPNIGFSGLLLCWAIATAQATRRHEGFDGEGDEQPPTLAAAEPRLAVVPTPARDPVPRISWAEHHDRSSTERSRRGATP